MKFLKNIFLPCLSIFILSSCGNQNSTNESTVIETPSQKYSLAQWSYNRDLFAGEMNTIDFVNAAGEMGFEGVEYVSQFFQDKAENFPFLDSLNEAARNAGVKNLMIQVDNIGNLCASDPMEREKAITEGKKWVNATKYLGCPIMRVNAHGDGSPENMKKQCLDGIGLLADYANSQGVKIIIENHGGISSDGDWLADLIKNLEEKKVGSLADFHNWCSERSTGNMWNGPCTKEYDYYKGLADLMPTAEGVSVKAFNFDSLGNETQMDFKKFFQIIHDHNYTGYLGIEYEGNTLPSKEGILKTKALADRSW